MDLYFRAAPSVVKTPFASSSLRRPAQLRRGAGDRSAFRTARGRGAQIVPAHRAAAGASSDAVQRAVKQSGRERGGAQKDEPIRNGYILPVSEEVRPGIREFDI